MGVKCSVDTGAIDNYFKAVIEIVNEELKNTFAYLGEECITKVRARGFDESWIDRTGNLRSSIGYGVYEHGKKSIESTFAIVKKGTSGPQAGKQLLDELSKMYADTYALVVVAGMDYADEVEALENKDVLASTELYARSVINDRMKKTKKKILSRIDKLSL